MSGVGAERRTVWYPAPGRFDYGDLPRATPLIQNGLANLYGAFGTLSCVDLDNGKLRWRRELKREFPPAENLPWGLASSPWSSPWVVDGRVIVQPSGRMATLLALHPATGRTLW